jgi:predicted phage terminase large subunit-like protein
LRPDTLAHTLTRGTFAQPPHLRLLADRLALAALGRAPRLIVQMPPRHGKSECASHWFPTWLLSLWPERRVILTSYEADFAASWGRKVRNTLGAHRDALGVRIADDSAAANRWETVDGGGMLTAGVGGPITGRGAHVLIVDDPVKNADEAASPTYRQRTWEWWQSTAYTRLEPDGAAVVVMTRWHEDDLAGRLLAEMQAGGERWDVLNLPAIAEAEDLLGRPEGAALWPSRYDGVAFERIKRAVGSRVWTALYQQRPAPDEGDIFKRDWWRFYQLPPATFDAVIQSWDMAFKDKATSDFVVGQVWGARGADRFLLDQVRGRMNFPATLVAVRALSAKWPQATLKLVEDKANGTAVIDTLRSEIGGLVAVEPEGGKMARAQAVSPQVEARNVHLPDPLIAPWVGDFVEETAAFPNAPHDDQVDTMTQALLRLGASHDAGGYFAAAPSGTDWARPVDW